jgi:ABC-type glycerol-3-phosphate transport system permease component
MDKKVVQIIVIIFLLTLVLSPFAGLAPLMLLLVGLGLLWASWSLLQVILSGSSE